MNHVVGIMKNRVFAKIIYPKTSLTLRVIYNQHDIKYYFIAAVGCPV